jgi:anaerobic carbon-monoxide dehydrogenase iron sulfur subunit
MTTQPAHNPLRRIVADAEQCRGCEACLLACSLRHEGVCDPRLARLVVSRDMATYTVEMRICRHCDDPACVTACPSGALAPDAHGVAVLDEATCSRCGLCAQACPYAAIVHHAGSDRYLKCDLCAGAEEGPWCVAVCGVGALTLEDASGL